MLPSSPPSLLHTSCQTKTPVNVRDLGGTRKWAGKRFVQESWQMQRSLLTSRAMPVVHAASKL